MDYTCVIYQALLPFPGEADQTVHVIRYVPGNHDAFGQAQVVNGDVRGAIREAGRLARLDTYVKIDGCACILCKA